MYPSSWGAPSGAVVPPSASRAMAFTAPRPSQPRCRACALGPSCGTGRNPDSPGACPTRPRCPARPPPVAQSPPQPARTARRRRLGPRSRCPAATWTPAADPGRDRRVRPTHVGVVVAAVHRGHHLRALTQRPLRARCLALPPLPFSQPQSRVCLRPQPHETGSCWCPTSMVLWCTLPWSSVKSRNSSVENPGSKQLKDLPRLSTSDRLE